MATTQKMHPRLEQASRFAHAAVEMDNLGNYKEAIGLYSHAIQNLDQALADPSFSQSRDSVKQCRASYAARVDSLHKEMSGALPVLPAPPTSNGGPASTALATPAQDPSVVDVGVEAVKAANRDGGKYLVQGYQTAKELNERHQITHTIASGVKSTYSAAVAANEKYKVVDNVKAGVSSAYGSAVQLNEKHQITKKVGTIASASVKKVGELNQEYRVTDRVGSALLGGLNYLATQSQQYLQGSSSSSSQAPPSSSSSSAQAPSTQPALPPQQPPSSQ
ncbi:hypothetical protein PTSG_00680 [Salpingoeca rosetta]|uniref:MIT domain-containing protein n=1 Tax=Salpingoeca rosetta (strain ATCC 50818 / BSB-021) TaxID=946362 RepID=F2TX63_SALR5|nr:uncharacterized protein PTSG_00680 [Salpingoeca rosetta]EGD75972.1 hypothetical protein PTSG_00680 [Salpingoeca rosetta]|eukprot:XP_004998147.1 hypothetical protein PTSG_00680 [Salpingoeca rosetta]